MRIVYLEELGFNITADVMKNDKVVNEFYSRFVKEYGLPSTISSLHNVMDRYFSENSQFYRDMVHMRRQKMTRQNWSVERVPGGYLPVFNSV